METSKSEGNMGKEPHDTKNVVDNQTVAIVDTNVEREIQNVLITSEYDHDQPCCSWKVTGESPTKGNKDPPQIVQADGSTSSMSISIDVNCLPHQQNLTRVDKNNGHLDELESHKATSHREEIGQNNSLMNLFDGIELLEPATVTLPTPLVRSQPITQLPPVTRQIQPQPPAVTSQPLSTTNRPQVQCTRPLITNLRPTLSPPTTQHSRAQSSIHSRNTETPPTSSRGIHVLNIPNDSINRSIQRTDLLVSIPNNSTNRVLQRADQVLGPPPSYSKSLLDRRINTCASIQFVAPIPPPSYDGMESELRYAHTAHSGGFTLGLGNTWQGQPQPAYCPVCETVIITQVDVRVSRIAHIFAMVMFLLLCWPFCLLPYFLNICNYTFHYCSVCHSYLGARRPFHHG